MYQSNLRFLYRDYLVLVNKGDESIISFNFNGYPYIFICSEKDWDKSGWKNADGFKFKEKLYILNFPVNVAWKYINGSELVDLFYKYRLLHPWDLVLNVEQRKLKISIIYNNRKKKVNKYELMDKVI